MEPKECKNPTVEEFVTHQQEVMVQVKDALYQAQRTMEEFANRGKNDTSFIVGQEVYLNTRNLGKNHFMPPEVKMRARFCGPFPIIELKASKYTYKLKLPARMSRLYPVLYFMRLYYTKLLRLMKIWCIELCRRKLQNYCPCLVEEERMFDEEGIECFEIESVSDRRRLPTSRAMEYLVKWKGYEKLHDTWITKKEAVTSGALKLLTDFDRTVTSGINLPDANRTSQIMQDLSIGVTAAKNLGASGT